MIDTEDIKRKNLTEWSKNPENWEKKEPIRTYDMNFKDKFGISTNDIAETLGYDLGSVFTNLVKVSYVLKQSFIPVEDLVKILRDCHILIDHKINELRK